MSFTESEFIAAITAGMAGAVPVGPGDDAAVLADGTVLTADAITEGVHFVSGTAPELLARKALGRPLSDLCAAGAEPQQVLVVALLPPGCDGPALAAAFNAEARRLRVAIIGGDTKRTAPGALSFAVTAVGRCASGTPWRRRGARPGDALFVSGPLGGAGGGRHLQVTPRTDVVAALRGARTPVHAATDLSDGLARNLRLLCAASEVGAVVEAEALPVHADVAPGRDGVLAALGDGEDYELLLALPPGGTPPLGLTRIGTVTAGRELLLHREGLVRPLPDTGYEHVI
jgi:thiamine-monophosphate kinase